MALSPGGIVPRDMNARQFSEWARSQQVVPRRDVKSFTPTWTGFSVDPVGDVKYVNLGSLAMVWTEAQLTGTSNSAVFVLSGLPEEIWPTLAVSLQISLFDASAGRAGAVSINSSGDMTFYLAEVTGSQIGYTTLFTASGSKGLGVGTVLLYPID